MVAHIAGDDAHRTAMDGEKPPKRMVNLLNLAGVGLRSGPCLYMTAWVPFVSAGGEVPCAVEQGHDLAR